MGQTLSEPVKEKHSATGHDDRLIYASSAMQGWRVSMEDAHTALLQLIDKKGYSFFGVYDGHGGQNVAKYSGNHLHESIVKEPDFGNNLENAIKNGFLKTDDDLKKDPQFANDPSGCTAVTAVVTPDNCVYVGNAGDSRAVLSVDGVAEPMSTDHKPLNQEENLRISKAGGFVEFGRVNGNLALSRAIGDFEFKQNLTLGPQEQIVTAYPEVKKVDIINERTEFLVLACDGIWDCLSSQQVVSFIRHNISEKQNLQTTCEDLMETCLAKDSELGGIGCDNMTVIIVGFLHKQTEKQWYEWMAERYNKDIGPRYKADDVKPPKNDDLDMNLNDDVELEIAADSSTDADLENQNALFIDDSFRSNSGDNISDLNNPSLSASQQSTYSNVPGKAKEGSLKKTNDDTNQESKPDTFGDKGNSPIKTNYNTWPTKKDK